MMKSKLQHLLLILILGLAVSLWQGPQVQAAPDSEPMSFLFLGIDTGELGRTEQGRSDTIMVMTLNPSHKTLRLVSLPRDTYVNIEGYEGMDKLNHAYAYGGAELSKLTVEHLLDVPIQHYLALNMKGLEDLVDLVGGVEVVPPETFTIDGYEFYQDTPVYLDGRTALYYVRDRFSSSGDYARQARQRQVLEALMHKVQDASFKLDPLKAASLMTSVSTDLSLEQLMGLFNQCRQAGLQVELGQLQGQGQTINGIYYDIPDQASLAELRTTLLSDLKE